MYTNTTGLILRETAYKDSSKILTVLTDSMGRLTVMARGALRRNSKMAAATQLLVYSEMTLFNNRDRWTLTEARCVEQFSGLRGDIINLALGSYFAELAEAVSDEDCPGAELLPLCLNTLFALSEGLKTAEYVKPVFELRLMAASGFSPSLESCVSCGKETPEYAFLDLVEGHFHCGDCAPSGDGALLSRSAMSAARYILGCSPKKLFSFTLGKAALRELSTAAEAYLLTQLDRRFRTLEYYKQLGVMIQDSGCRIQGSGN